MLSTDRYSQQQLKSRTSVVDPKFPDMQWRYLIQPQKFFTISTDASKKSWGVFCQGIPTGGKQDL